MPKSNDSKLKFSYDNAVLSALIKKDEPFTMEATRGELAGVQIGSLEGQELLLWEGEPIGLAIPAEGSIGGRIAICWDAESFDERMRRLLPETIDFEKFGVIAFSCDVNVGFKARGGSPIGSYLTASAKGEANGGLSFFNYLLFPKGESARKTLADLYGGLRMPTALPAREMTHDCTRSMGMELQAGLRLWGSVVAGYETQGSRDLSIEGLAPEIQYKVAVGASVAVEMAIGGRFEIVQSEGQASNWTRVRIYRSRQYERSLVLGLDVGADFSVSGLTEDPDQLLRSITGTDLGSGFEWLKEVSTTKDWNEAKQKLTAKYGKIVGENAADLIEAVTGSADIQAAQTKINAILQSYRAFTDGVDERLLEIASAYLGDSRKTIESIDKILTIDRANLSDLSDSHAWKVIDQLAGDALHEFVSSQDAFLAVRSQLVNIRKVLEGEAESAVLRDFIEEQERRFNVDRIAKALATAADPQAMKDYLANGSNELAMKMFDVTVGKLSQAKLEKTFQSVQSAAKRILAWRGKVATVLKEGYERKLQLSLAMAYGRSQSQEAWVDIEFDHSVDPGRKAMTAALSGDFVESLQAYQKGYVLVRQAEFQRELSKTKTLKLHAFGWGSETFAQVKRLTKVKVEQQGGGVAYLYDTSLAQEMFSKSGFGAAESIATLYQLRIQSSALSADPARSTEFERKRRKLMIGELGDISSQYTVERSDSNPHWDEVADYLRFAEQLGIVEGRTQLRDSLKNEFGPADPESLEIKYEIRNSQTSFAHVFENDLDRDTNDEQLLRDKASKAFRAYFADRYYAKPNAFFSKESLDAYLACYRMRRKKIGPASKRSLKYRYVFEDEQGSSIRSIIGGSKLKKAYDAEKRFLKAFLKVDKVLDTLLDEDEAESVHLKDLERAAMALMEVPLRTPLSVWKDNVFFLVLDSLQRQADPESRRGLATMQIDIKPQGRDAIRRFLTA